MVPCRVIYLFGQGKGAQARGWTDEGGTEIFEGGTCPPVPPPSDAPAYMIRCPSYSTDMDLGSGFMILSKCL